MLQFDGPNFALGGFSLELKSNNIVAVLEGSWIKDKELEYFQLTEKAEKKLKRLKKQFNTIIGALSSI